MEDPHLLVQEQRLIYINSVKHLIVSNEEFILALISDGVIIGKFVFSPAHLKRFSLLLNKIVSEHEKVYGVINTTLPQPLILQDKEVGFGVKDPSRDSSLADQSLETPSNQEKIDKE